MPDFLGRRSGNVSPISHSGNVRVDRNDFPGPDFPDKVSSTAACCSVHTMLKGSLRSRFRTLALPMECRDPESARILLAVGKQLTEDGMSVGTIHRGSMVLLFGVTLHTMAGWFPVFGAEVTGSSSSGGFGPAPGVSSKALSQEQWAVNPKGYTSASVCGECHADIYKTWKRSLHASSLTDPIFNAAYMQAIKEGGEEARRNCLVCHAPMTVKNGDYQLKEEVSREGVSCDFCHTVTGVQLGSARPYTIDLGPVKRGVIKEAASPAHEVAFSELHGKSEFCGGCHNYVAPSGSAILSTYDEWRKGPYAAEGIQCQDCHMVLSAGKVVSERIQPSSGQIHLHSLVHDTIQLRSALEVRVPRAQRVGNNLEVEVLVENVKSGHMVPTGIPTREVVLEVTVQSGGYTRRQVRRYRKVVANERGQPLLQDYEVILRGARILNDNRIAPREVRTERFQFPVRGTQPIQVSAELSYQYSPVIMSERKIKVDLDKVDQLVH